MIVLVVIFGDVLHLCFQINYHGAERGTNYCLFAVQVFAVRVFLIQNEKSVALYVHIGGAIHKLQHEQVKATEEQFGYVAAV